MSFKEIFCQDKAVNILHRSFINDRVAHSYIFAGIDGIGKFKTACEFAKLLLCEKPAIKKDSADSCGKCHSCISFDVGSHPDFNHIYKELLEFTNEGKDKETPIEFPIDVVREFLINKVSIKPQLSQRRVFIISESEKLNQESQNALLKVLEEPPAYCCIILICTRPDKLFSTIRSRCQVLRFGPVAEEQTVEKLTEMGLEKKASQYFARLSFGSFGLACSWAKLELAGANLYETAKNLITSLSTLKYADTLNLADRILKQSRQLAEVWEKLESKTSKKDINRRAVTTIITIIISALHDTIKLNLAPDKPLINFGQKTQIKSLADKLTPEQAAEKIAETYKTIQWLDDNVNEKLLFEQLLLNLAIYDKMKV